MTDSKEAIRNAILAARQAGLSSGQIIGIVEVEFTKTEATSSASERAGTGDDVRWKPLTEDLKTSKQSAQAGGWDGEKPWNSGRYTLANSCTAVRNAERKPRRSQCR